MHYSSTTRAIALIDLILLTVCMILLLWLVSVAPFFNIDGITGQPPVKINVIWIFVTGVYGYFFLKFFAADMDLMHLTAKDTNYERKVKVFLLWVQLSKYTIALVILLFTMFTVCSIDELANQKLQSEKGLKRAIMTTFLLFAVQRIVGVYFVNNIQLKMQNCLSDIPNQQSTQLQDINVNQEDEPPKYEDLVQTNISDPPPAFDNVTVTSETRY